MSNEKIRELFIRLRDELKQQDETLDSQTRDVLAELDLNRQNQLLEAIGDRFQTLITTTHLGVFDAEWLNTSQVLTVKAGRLAV